MTRVNWRRYWCRRGQTYHVDDQGFLDDPDSGGWARYSNQHLLTTEQLLELKCAVLLGEPGLGKTDCLGQLAEIARSGGVLFKLSQYNTDQGIIGDVFRSERINDWKLGSSDIRLLLDGTDECRVRIATLSEILADKISRLPTDRLMLVIACRTTTWMTSFQTLERALNEQFGEIEVFELAPLRRQDVHRAAVERRCDGDAFVEALVRRSVVPLACRPVTLTLLLDIFCEAGELPTSKVELYKNGTRRLVTELSTSRSDSGAAGQLSPDQRFAVAARVAAVMTLSGFARVRIRGDAEDGELTIEMLCGGYEGADGDRTTVDESALKEALDTGLFTGMGVNHVAFAHHSYQEYLAAAFVGRRELTRRELQTILQLGPDGRVPPQLVGVAGWLAASSSNAHELLLSSDPRAVLEGDPGKLAAPDRQRLAESLLSAFETRAIVNTWWGARNQYHNLANPKLYDLLRETVSDGARNPVARRVAIDIGAACSLDQLVPLFAQRALDPEEHRGIREHAVWAVAESRNDEAKTALKPLLLLPADQDPDDNLKGHVLRALWPDQLTAAELFSNLSEPRRTNYVGSYSVFLNGPLIEGMSDEDWPVGLRWLQKQPYAPTDHGTFADLKAALVSGGLERVDIEEVRRELVPCLLSRLRAYDDQALKPATTWPAAKRRILADALVASMRPSTGDAVSITMYPTRLLFAEDVFWVIERLNEATGNARNTWAFILSYIYDVQNPYQVDSVLRVFADWPDSECPVLRYVQLDSDKAKAMRQHAQWVGDQSEAAPPSEEESRTLSWADLRDLLEPGANQVLERWATFCARITDGHLSPPDSAPLWKSATSEQMEEVLALARRVVTEAKPQFDSLIRRRSVSYQQLAVYYAWQTLFDLDASFLDALDSQIWQRWAPLIYAAALDDKPTESTIELRRLAYRRAPKAVLDAVDGMIRAQQQGAVPQSDLVRTRSIWDEEVASLLHKNFKSGQLSPETNRELIRILLEHEHEDAAAFALELVVNEDSATAVPAGVALLEVAVSDSWSAIWARVQEDAEFGRRLFLAYAQRTDLYGSQGIFEDLSEEQLAELYKWLAKEFPPAEDPELAGTLSPRHSVSDLRRGLLRVLRDKGTTEALEVLEALATDDPNLTFVLAAARDAALKDAWRPPSIEQVVNVGKRPRAVILTALDLEYRAVRAHLSNIVEETDPVTGAVVDVGLFEGWDVAVVHTGPYEHRADGRTRDAVRMFDPDVAMYVGVAGALKDVAVGDVVVATSAYLYEAGKEVDGGILPRAEGSHPHPKLRERATAEARKAEWRERIIEGGETPDSAVEPETSSGSSLLSRVWRRLRAATVGASEQTASRGPPDVVCGKIVSGSKVLASAKGDTRAFLRRNYSDAVAVEMEGHGFLYSANETSCPALLVRGISDNVDDKAKRDAEGWQPVAAARAAAFAFHALSRFDPGLLKRQSEQPDIR